MSKTLIYTAQLHEAQTLINFLKLSEKTDAENLPEGNKLFFDEDNKYLLIVSGNGKRKCMASLEYVYENYEIEKAISIGAAGSSDSSIKIGTLFTTNRLLPNINFASITTVDTPLESDEELDTILVDMESWYFQEFSKKYCSDVYTFKVVSDYLDIEAPEDSFVTKLIEDSLPLWNKYL